MKAKLEPTNRFTDVNGVPCRIWQGETPLGVRFHAYIALVAVRNDADTAEFERFLKEVAEPTPDVAAMAGIPLRRIL